VKIRKEPAVKVNINVESCEYIIISYQGAATHSGHLAAGRASD